MQPVVSTLLSELLRITCRKTRINTGFRSGCIHLFPRMCFPNTTRMSGRCTYINNSDVHCCTYCGRHSHGIGRRSHDGGQGVPATSSRRSPGGSRRGGGRRRKCRPGTEFGRSEETRGMGRNDTGADVPGGTPAPRLLRHSLRRPGCLGQNPAARSCSRSRSTAAGECSERLPLSRTGMSWRWRARVRLATMAATATRLTPKVRISRLRVGSSNGAPSGASRVI